MKRTNEERDSFRITDREALARLLKDAIAERGPQSIAASAAGISGPTLSRLLNRKTARVTLNTLEGIYELVPAARHDEVRKAVLSPTARRLVDGALRTWRDRMDAAFRDRGFPRWSFGEGGIQERPDMVLGPGHTAGGRTHEILFLMRVTRAMFPELYERFYASVNRFGHAPERLYLAMFRVIEPLLDARQTGFIDREWVDLLDGDENRELRAFVKAGLERERILLNRPGEVQRAQDIEELPAEEFSECDWSEWAKELGVPWEGYIWYTSDAVNKLAGGRGWQDA